MSGPLPLNGLRAFFEVARHQSGKRAAEALGVTPGAVSQQLKALEGYLGTCLLQRNARNLSLTPAGARLYRAISAGFQQIEDGVESFRGNKDTNSSRQSLVVTTTVSLAATCLVPRLGEFTAENPNIEVRIETTETCVDLLSETRIDVAIRHGLGEYKGLHATYLLSPNLIPVCSPLLLFGKPRPQQPSDCLQFPLLQDSDRADWLLWLRGNGVKAPEAALGPSFADDALLVKAAVAGQGIALVRDVSAREEVAAGRLVVAPNVPCPTPFSYHVVTRPTIASRPKVVKFREWLARVVA